MYTTAHTHKGNVDPSKTNYEGEKKMQHTQKKLYDLTQLIKRLNVTSSQIQMELLDSKLLNKEFFVLVVWQKTIIQLRFVHSCKYAE